jgi:lipoprotein-anchoring transpeptidase ErfK/SrfK
MKTLLSRRSLLGGGLLLAVAPTPNAIADYLLNGEDAKPFDPRRLPPSESRIDFPIKTVSPDKIKKRYRRQVVEFEDPEGPGTIVIDPDNRFLYLVEENATATRFGVGVGRSGFEWSGTAVIGMKRRWPRWVPPPEMVYRDDNAAKWANGMPGGPDNPARCPGSLSLPGRRGHAVPHSRNQPALIDRQGHVLWLHSHAQRGRGSALRQGLYRHPGCRAAVW